MMQGVRFYEEVGKNTVLAVMSNTMIVGLNGVNEYYALYDAVGTLTEFAGEPIGATSVADWWLRESCRRVSEKRAREIHPALFTYLEQGG